MARYKCAICGYIYDEEEAGAPFSTLEACPICKQPPSKFEKLEDAPGTGSMPQGVQNAGGLSTVTQEPGGGSMSAGTPETVVKGLDLSYPKDYARSDSSIPHMEEIHEVAVAGSSISAAMATELPLPKWEEILILGAQLDPMPLDHDAEVDTKTAIGPQAEKPMVLDNPVYISHMSFGALSKEAKTALAKGSALGHSAMCSGEGGILPEERAAADKYIFEYVPNRYSDTDENLRNSDAIEIKIGQGTKPGMGGHLPGEKVTEEIACIREKPMGQDVQSPSRFPDINSREDLKKLVSDLRSRSQGRPVGIKLSAGNIESDLDFALAAEPDFITIDGRGGATGSSPRFLRDASSVPTLYALSRARRFLDSRNSKVSLVITGGLRVSADFAKAIAMGADAIAVATAPLMAAGCQQYRICGSGTCPVGIATQDPKLRARLDMEDAAQRVGNYLNVMLSELKTFARVTGHVRLHDLSVRDLVTTNRDIADYTGISFCGAFK